MNANSIWAGEEYAYIEYKPNKGFVKNARRIRAIKVEKHTPMFKERATAFVIGDRLHADTGELIAEGIRVRVRDCIDFWDSYVAEREALYGEELERERVAREQREKLRLEMEERIKQQNEAREARQRADAERREKLIKTFIERTSIPEVAIAQISETHVTLDRTSLELWLSTPQGIKIVEHGTDRVA